jgi:hypothetical protein
MTPPAQPLSGAAAGNPVDVSALAAQLLLLQQNPITPSASVPSNIRGFPAAPSTSVDQLTSLLSMLNPLGGASHHPSGLGAPGLDLAAFSAVSGQVGSGQLTSPAAVPAELQALLGQMLSQQPQQTSSSSSSPEFGAPSDSEHDTASRVLEPK